MTIPDFQRIPGPSRNVNVTGTGELDLLNSSSATLGSAGVFTGDWVDVSGVDSMTIAVSTDADGSYAVQFSPDAVNVDSTLTRYYRTARINAPHRFTVTRKYMRVVYTNGSSAQSYFRLQVMFGLKQPLNVPTDGIMAQDYDAIVVRPTEPYDEVALGLRQGETGWDKWGYNLDIDTAAEETIWEPGGDMTFLTSAETLDIVSTDANDVDAGTGAHGVVVYGIDANRESQVEVVLLNGLTDVTTTNTWLGVNRMALYRAGSGSVNAGRITATASTALTVQASIPAGEGTTQQAIFFTQAGHTALARDLFINAVKTTGGGNPLVVVRGWVLSFVSNAKYEVFRYNFDTQRGDHMVFGPRKAFPVGEKSVLWFTASTDTNNTAMAVRFSAIERRLAAT